jgi:ABC-type glutathione transport system ATPase component
MQAPSPDGLLEISNLSLTIGSARILRDVSFAIAPGEAVGLIGESGSGKSMLARTVLGFQPGAARLEGSLHYKGRSLIGLSETEYRRLRGPEFGYVPQDPAASYNPTLTVGQQISEPNEFHPPAPGEVRQTAAQMLATVGINEPERRARQYPHELSGGMLQRGLIASAVSLTPSLLIADEPTTALDVTSQAGIVSLLQDIQSRTGMALLLISHDLALVSMICSRIVVLYRGEIVEQGATEQVVGHPSHDYTRALLAATPTLDDLPVEAAP